MENTASPQYLTMDASAGNEELKRNDESKRVRMTSNRRYFCYFLTTTLLFLAVSWVATNTGTGSSEPVQRRLAEAPAKQKILYIVTTLAEYNSGTRSTVRGSDRLQETLIPILSEGVRSMLADGYEVDGT
jgi:bacteriorhodopsin